MYEYKCKILRIVDGDTVDVDIDLGFGIWRHRERVRLVGIDTPESRTRDLVEKKFGLAAKEFVRFMMPVGSAQTITTQKDKTGKFGRILGEVLKMKLEKYSNILQRRGAELHEAVTRRAGYRRHPQNFIYTNYAAIMVDLTKLFKDFLLHVNQHVVKKPPK